MSRDTKFLDVFRGIAALWVCLAHCWIWSAGELPAALDPKLAVDLFMVLSGFLMVFTIDRRAEHESPERWDTWRKFYFRRFFRIAPAYYVALLATWLTLKPATAAMANLQALAPARWAGTFYEVGYQNFSLTSILLHLSFLFGLLPRYASSTGLPDWSLSLEMQFYWVFPLIYLALRKAGFWLVCIGLTLACVVFIHFYYATLASGVAAPFPEPSLLPLNLPRFLVGALIYEAGRKRSPALLALAGAIALYVVRPHGLASTPLLAALAALTSCWWFGVPTAGVRLFETRPVRALSDLSYSLYLFHGIVLFLVGWPVLSMALGYMPMEAARVVMAAFVVAVAYVVSWVVYKGVELPGNKIGKRLSGSPRSVAPPMT